MADEPDVDIQLLIHMAEQMVANGVKPTSYKLRMASGLRYKDMRRYYMWVRRQAKKNNKI